MVILREQQGTLQPYFPAFLLSLFYFLHDRRRHTKHEPAPPYVRAPTLRLVSSLIQLCASVARLAKSRAKNGTRWPMRKLVVSKLVPPERLFAPKSAKCSRRMMFATAAFATAIGAIVVTLCAHFHFYEVAVDNSGERTHSACW
jgi:hypothetical protein